VLARSCPHPRRHLRAFPDGTSSSPAYRRGRRRNGGWDRVRVAVSVPEPGPARERPRRRQVSWRASDQRVRHGVGGTPRESGTGPPVPGSGENPPSGGGPSGRAGSPPRPPTSGGGTPLGHRSPLDTVPPGHRSAWTPFRLDTVPFGTVRGRRPALARPRLRPPCRRADVRSPGRSGRCAPVHAAPDRWRAPPPP
jgi:hypothetical protein